MRAKTGVMQFDAGERGIFIHEDEICGWIETLRQAAEQYEPDDVLSQELNTLMAKFIAVNYVSPTVQRLRYIPVLGEVITHCEYKIMREIVLDAARDFYQAEDIGMSKQNVAELVGYLTIRMAETEE